MECKNCEHSEVCKWREKFEMCQGSNDRKPIQDAPFYIESKCTLYKSKENNYRESILCTENTKGRAILGV